MQLPPPVDVSDDAVAAIASRHGLRIASFRVMPSNGIINTVIALDDRFVLRVPRDHPGHVAQARIEADAIPLAVAAGIRTPALVAFDDALDLLPVPYLLVEQVAGRDLESVGVDPAQATEVWTEVGRDLGRLHLGVDPARWPGPAWPDDPASASYLVPGASADLDELVRLRVAEGWLSAVEGGWLTDWLGLLDDGSGEPLPVTATHGDLQMSNVLVDPATGRYRALLDWGCAARKDAVIDFMPLPFAAVPHLLDGHRQVGPLADDRHAERRILKGRIHALLALLPRGAAPGTSWGERPVAWLADLVRFFSRPPNDRWRALAPPPGG